MILSCQGISKSFGEKVILEDASFHIEEREKAALIGNNGAGKTTLLRIIMEEIHADAGQVVLAKDKRIGYLAQYQDVQGHLSVYEELLSTKQYIIDMEERLRAMEVQMKNASGEELDRTDLVSGDSYLSVPLPGIGPGWGERLPLVDPASSIASPFGWHDTDGVVGAESTLTIGNNVSAYTDVDADNQPDPGSQPDGGAGLEFSFPFDPALDPSSLRAADVVSLFALTNSLHDILYSFGFDESSGNFQTNNYGRGGVAGDAIRAEAQNGGAVNNANFVTPPDGFPARMQFYLFDALDPDRSASLDNTIVTHEYGHGLSNRLTGGPSNVSCLQNSEQPGEGWSDYLALMLTSDAGATRDDARGIATYALGQPPSGPGIRLAPYSTDMAVDTRSYGDVASASIPFGVGSVLTSMLWDMTWDLTDRYGYDPDLADQAAGNHLALQLVIDGLKLQPCNPGFTDVRDAILVADQITNAGLNSCLIWEAFARRGLGWSADQGSPLDRTDGTEAFDTPPQCAPLALTVVAANVDPLPGSTVRFDVTVSNNTVAAQTDVSVAATVGAGSTVVGGSPGAAISPTPAPTSATNPPISQCSRCPRSPSTRPETTTRHHRSARPARMRGIHRSYMRSAP